jgi:hypothetical protein
MEYAKSVLNELENENVTLYDTVISSPVSFFTFLVIAAYFC